MSVVKIRNRKGGGGRKIDEWTVALPGGKKASFDVLLEYQDGVAVNVVQGSAPHFQDCRLFDSDLNRLIEKLEAHVEQVIASEISIGWSPAHVVETRVRNQCAGPEGRRFSLSINLQTVEHRPEDRVGNLGETVVRSKHSQKIVVQRGHEDDFAGLEPKSGSLLDPEVAAWMSSPLWNEPGDDASRVVVPQAAETTLTLVDALEDFGMRLARRLSFSEVSRNGMPAPEDLIDIMRAAVCGATEPGEPS